MDKEFSNLVEVWEVKVFEIKARSKADADLAINQLMNAQDELVELKASGAKYRAVVKRFSLRDWPQDKSLEEAEGKG